MFIIRAKDHKIGLNANAGYCLEQRKSAPQNLKKQERRKGEKRKTGESRMTGEEKDVKEKGFCRKRKGKIYK